MKYQKTYEARQAFRKYKPYEHSSESKLEWFCYWNKSLEIKMGDFILFQHITSDNISRPILALFVGWSTWDQALVMNFVEVRRAYYFSDKYIIVTNPAIDHEEYLGHLDPEVEHIQFWTDNIKLLGHYKSKPTFRELKLDLINNT